MGRRSTFRMLLAAPALLVAPLLVAAALHPTPVDWRHLRFERERQGERWFQGEGEGRTWSQGRKQGRTEMEFLAQYETLRTQPSGIRRSARGDAAIATAQALANATGEPVDVIVG